MRDDDIGLFSGMEWGDHQWFNQPKDTTRGGGKRDPFAGPMPPIPETGWLPPTEFPNLSASKVIGVDTETYDPALTEEGPGWGRGKGHIVGVSISAEDGTSWYFPVRHEIMPEHNLDPDAVFRYLRHTLGGAQPKVGANLIYDVGWLQEEGVHMGGMFYDVQYAEALLNSETPSVALDMLANKYLGHGKETELLYEWLARWNSKKPNDKQRKWIYKTPPCIAGPYAEGDAWQPVKILEKQWPKMVERGVLDLFHLECNLIPLLVAMRRKGAPVDIEKAHSEHDALTEDLDVVKDQLRAIAGQEVNPNAQDSIRSAFEALNLPIPTVIDKKKGERRVSFAAGVLKDLDHPLCHAILEHRQIAKVRDTFIESYIIDKNINGRVHCSFNPLRGDGYGARSGRFSSSDPNLQNIPTRTDLGKRVRRLFAVLQGSTWISADFSQIEYRMLAHHAVDKGDGSAEIVRQRYRNEPDLDYHDFTIDLIEELTGIRMDRKPAKNINFGLIYGMSNKTLAGNLGLSTAKANQLFSDYHSAVPFAKATMEDCSNEVHRLGYVTTVLGRKSDFNMWSKKGFGDERVSLPYQAASAKWGPYNIERGFTHKALNRKLQGGAADVMKAAMVRCYQEGLFHESYCGIPMLTVHDELDFECTGDPRAEHWRYFKHIMETAIPQIRVPIVMDMEYGYNWGDVVKAEKFFLH